MFWIKRRQFTRAHIQKSGMCKFAITESYFFFFFFKLLLIQLSLLQFRKRLKCKRGSCQVIRQKETRVPPEVKVICAANSCSSSRSDTHRFLPAATDKAAWFKCGTSDCTHRAAITWETKLGQMPEQTPLTTKTLLVRHSPVRRCINIIIT